MTQMIVVNTQRRHLVLPLPKSKKIPGVAAQVGTRLLPGANLVDEKEMEELLDHRDVKEWIDYGWIKFQEDEDLLPANKMKAEDAAEYVRRLNSTDELTKISLNDTRKTVKDAVQRRLREIAKPVAG